MTDEKKYRTEVPNIIDDLGLDPHERALYVHYKRACGGNDCEWVESVRVTGKKTKMSFSKAGEARRGLVKRGLISLISKGNDGTAVRIANIWELNKVYYGQEPRPDIDGWTVDQLKEWCQGVHNTHTIMEEGGENGASEGTGVHNAHTSVHNTHNKKEPLKNEPIKESDEEEESHVREEKAAAIMAIYQNNINISESPLTTQEMLSDEFLDLPLFWWQEAVKIATDNSVRKWSYVRGILLRSKKAGLSPVAAGSPNGNGAGPGKAKGGSSSLFPPTAPGQPEPERIELTPEERILTLFKERAATEGIPPPQWREHIAPMKVAGCSGGRIQVEVNPFSKEILERKFNRVLDPIAQELSPGGFEYVVT